MDDLDFLESIFSSTMTPMSNWSGPLHLSVYGPDTLTGQHLHLDAGPSLGQPHHQQHGDDMISADWVAGLQDPDTDHRELETFAERFKQRRMKMGVTQTDVGKFIPLGTLSQSTVCRFESLLMSRKKMIALKLILKAWLEEAESQAKNEFSDPDYVVSALPAGEKKRKRLLEAYFAMQPRPSGEMIAAIAEELNLKKIVVKVWFRNRRQKQKRVMLAATQH